MRVTVAIFGVVVLAILGRFFWDDAISGEDVPRGVVVEGVAVGNTDRTTAADRLTAQLRPTGDITLTFDGDSRTQPAEAWGVVLDIDATLDEAESMRGGGIVRFLRWAASIVRDREVDAVWTIDRELLAAEFDDESLGLSFETSSIALVDGKFVPVEAETRPAVDIDALEAELREAVRSSNGPDTTIEVPTAGNREIIGDSSLADAANELTDTEIQVLLAGTLDVRTIESSVLRKWLDIRGVTEFDDLSFAADPVQETLASLYPEVGASGTNGVVFALGFDGTPVYFGATDGSACCAASSAADLFASLGSGEPVIVFPIEDPDAKGLAWAASLGIKELVGEFTTNYKPNQTRNINIARISELTRGAVIEPGETFSVNDFVGRRTTANGFVSAGVISNGLFSSSVGGGISQYATTLFNAAFFAGLDFGEYQSHSIYIDRYPYGREATVSFGAPDLQIVNTTPYGILLWPTTDADSITVRLYSTPYVTATQTGQTERREGTSCTRVTTERTRVFLEDGREEVDTVTARYRPEGINCDGGSTRPTTIPTDTSTTTTVPTSVP